MISNSIADASLCAGMSRKQAGMMNDVKKLSGKKIRTTPIADTEWNNQLITMNNIIA
jgi:hypothetical protein